MTQPIQKPPQALVDAVRQRIDRAVAQARHFERSHTLPKLFELEFPKIELNEALSLALEHAEIIAAKIDFIVSSCTDKRLKKAVLARLTGDGQLGIGAWSIEQLGLISGFGFDRKSNQLLDYVWLDLSAAEGSRGIIWPRAVSIDEVLRWVAESSDTEMKSWAKDRLADSEWPGQSPFHNLTEGDVDTYRHIRNVSNLPPLKETPERGPFIKDDKMARLTCFALLCQAERDVRDESAKAFIAISATSEHHALISSMRDAPKDAMRHRGAPADLNTYEGRVEIITPDGNNRPIQLTLPSDGFGDDVVRAIRNWRGSFGLRNWAAIWRQLTEDGRTGVFKWTLDAHLRALGQEDWSRKPKKKAEVSQLVELLTKFKLVVYGKNNLIRASAPLLHVVDGEVIETRDGSRHPWAIDGMKLKINPWIYHGVRNANTNEIGSNWFPQAAALGTLNHAHYEAALTLGLLLPFRWRWRWGENNDASYLDITASKLITLAGIKRRMDRTWDTLELNLNKLKEVGGLGGYEWLSGKNTLDGMIRLHMPKQAVDILVHGVPIRELPAISLPNTGAELRAWREGRGITQAQVAGILGVSLNTIEKAEGKPDKQLGPSIRKALPNVVRGPVANP